MTHCPKFSLVSNTCLLTCSLPPPPGTTMGTSPWFRRLLNIGFNRRRRQLVYIFVYLLLYLHGRVGLAPTMTPSSRAASDITPQLAINPLAFVGHAESSPVFGFKLAQGSSGDSRDLPQGPDAAAGIRSTPSPTAPRPWYPPGRRPPLKPEKVQAGVSHHAAAQSLGPSSSSVALFFRRHLSQNGYGH